MTAPLRRLMLALVALLLLVPVAQAAKVNGVTLDQPLAVPEFALQDQYGKPYTLDQLEGHWSLLLIGYTSCPDVCPFTLSNLAAVVEEMSTRVPPDKLPKVLFLAVDPARDKPVLREFMAQFHPDFVGLTGEPRAIRTLAKGVGGSFRLGKPDKHGDYSVAHSAAVHVIDSKGQVLARILPPMVPPETAGYIAALMRGRVASAAAAAGPAR